jgi:predicted HD phosphohydrolase
MYPLNSLDAVYDLLALCGKTGEYDEPIGLLPHSLQTADLLWSRYNDAELAIAGLLHDLGHAHSRPDVTRHGELAAEMIGGLYSERVTFLVRHHTDAKRYLVATDPKYYKDLSRRSKETLEMQGGAASEELCLQLATSEWIHDLINLRMADDQAKVLGRAARDLAFWRNLMPIKTEKSSPLVTLDGELY